MKLDKKDKEILYQLDINSRQSDNQIAKKVRLNKNTVWYRINRLVENKVIANFVTLMNPAKFGKFVYKLYLRLQDVREETWKEIKDYLVKNKQVFWVVKCEGNWDIITAMWVNDPFDFYKFYINFVSKFDSVILEKQITNQSEVHFFTRSYFSKNKGGIKTYWGGNLSKEKIDEIDLKILNLLVKNSRMPSTEIANKLNTTARVVGYRIKELLKKEIIAFSIQLNQKAYDYDYYKIVFYLKNLTKKRESAFIEFCKQQGNILYYIKTLGPWELEFEIETKDYKELNKILNSIRNEFGDIIKSCEPLLITEEHKGEYNILG